MPNIFVLNTISALKFWVISYEEESKIQIQFGLFATRLRSFSEHVNMIEKAKLNLKEIFVTIFLYLLLNLHFSLKHSRFVDIWRGFSALSQVLSGIFSSVVVKESFRGPRVLKFQRVIISQNDPNISYSNFG